MFQKLKQFKDMRDQAKQIQDTLSQESVEGTAGFGKVKITMNGAQKATGTSIDVSLLNPGDQKRVESLVTDAINDAVQKVHRVMAEKMKDKFGDFQMPELKG